MKRKKWSEEEIRILYENFPNEGIYKCIELLPNRNRTQIKAKIDSLHIKSNHRKKWTNEENEKLKIAWETYSMEDLLNEFPDRTYQEIQLHANWLGYHSKTNRKRKCNLEFLDLDNLKKESLYWWGFIMADGHIGKRGQLIIQLKNVDKIHLEKIAKHLNCEVKLLKNDFCRIACSDVRKIKQWREKLNMNETAKTYFPPNLKIFENDFIYFFIGFVDGDGCVWINKNYPCLKIELHSSWKENLEWMANLLKTYYNIKSVKVKISKKGTSVLSITNKNEILEILKYTKDIEYLERKWDKLNIFYK